MSDLNTLLEKADEAAANLEYAQLQSEMLQQELGFALRSKRESLGISAKDVAKCLGISIVHVCDMELVKRNPMGSPERLREWIRFLKEREKEQHEKA